MENLNIIIVEEQPDIMREIRKGLNSLKDVVFLEECSSTAEAHELMRDIEEGGDLVAVVISGKALLEENGARFISCINDQNGFRSARRVLLTENQSEILNDDGINCCVERLKDSKHLLNIVKILLSEYVAEREVVHRRLREVLNEEV